MKVGPWSLIRGVCMGVTYVAAKHIGWILFFQGLMEWDMHACVTISADPTLH